MGSRMIVDMYIPLTLLILIFVRCLLTKEELTKPQGEL